MRTLRTRVIQFAALAAPVMALSFATGIGPASASGHAHHLRVVPAVAAAPASVTWHKLSAINGWASADAIYHAGAPRYAVQGGIVYLSGSVHNGGSNISSLVAVLPPQARPNHVLYLSIYTLNETFGSLQIEPNGQMTIGSSPISNSRGFSSLAGISFPLKSLTQHKLHLLNGWVSRENVWHTGYPSYGISNGTVYLTGSLHDAGTSEQFAVLPPAARPSRTVYLETYTYRGTSGGLRIRTDGKIYAYSGRSASFTSLAGISFALSVSGAHTLHLLNGWTSAAGAFGSGNPAVSVHNGVVYLSGSLKQVSGTGAEFAVLPSADKPAHWLYLTTYSWAGAIAELEISPSGELWVYSPTTADAQDFTSLAGLSFPLGS